MSSVARGLKKVFRPVAKAVKKIAPYALMAAAVIYTGGAALGVSGMAGGWSAAAASLGTTIGGTGTLGTVLTGAVYQAGLGAAIGGGVAAATGGNIGRGIRSGAAVGVATGAATGLLAPGAVNMKTLAQTAQEAQGASTVRSGAGQIISEPLKPAAPNPQNGMQVADGTTAIKPPSPISVEGASSATATPSWLERNQGIVGPAISAAGTGLLAAAQGAENPAEERADEIRKNYGDQPYTGLLRPSDVRPDTSIRQSPQERFNTNYEFRWDPEQRRLVKVPTGA